MSTSNSGRTGLVLLVLAALAAFAIFFVAADPFGSGDAIDRDREAADADDARMEGAGEPGEQEARVEAGLSGLYGEGDLGAVRVRLLAVQSRQPLPDQPLALVSRTGSERTLTSGSDGVALFDRVAPGRGYRLEISGEGHAAVTVQGVNVMRGETTDLGDIMLGQNLVLRGRVLSDSGRPLPGSSVAAYTRDRRMLSEGFLSTVVKQVVNLPVPLEAATTDEDGWFTLKALASGSYRLEARHGGYATRYVTDVVVSKERPARDMTIVLGEGASAVGRVTDDVGKAVVDARVIAVRDDNAGRRGPPMNAGAVVERDVAFTDATGHYVIDTLTLGANYRFGVVAEGYAPQFAMNSDEIEHKRFEKDFQLVLGGTITGRVLNKTDGTPVADAEILVVLGQMGMGRRSADSGGGSDVGTGTARTDEKGVFRLENLLPGPVMSAQARATGYVPFGASPFTGNAWPAVEAGGVAEVEVELEPGGTVQGKILDGPSGDPIAGADVSLLPRQNMWQTMWTGSPTGRTGADGSYVIAGVRKGEYGVVAVAPGYAASDARADETKVDMPDAGGTVARDVRLKRAGLVTGKVTDAKGEPIAGARVRTRRGPSEGGGGRRGRGGRFAAMLPGGSGADLTDQDGRFVIQDVSSDQSWILTVEAEEFVETDSDPFRVQAGETKEVDITLSTGGALEGRVLDDRGGFVAGATVRVGHLPPDTAGRARLRAWDVDRLLNDDAYHTDEEGRFRASNLKPGATVVKVEREGYITFYKRNVVITADETWENYMVSMTRGDTLEGRVRGADGTPLENVWVGITKRDDPLTEADESAETEEDIEPMLVGQTDGDGKFTIDNIPPGMVTVVVWFAPGHKSYRRDKAESAIRRGVSSSSAQVEFRLEAQEAGAGFPGGGNR